MRFPPSAEGAGGGGAAGSVEAGERSGVGGGSHRTSPDSDRHGPALEGSPVQRLQPRTVGQLLDGGFEVLRFRFRTIALVAAPIVLPLMVIPQIVILASGGFLRSNPLFSGGSNPFDAATSDVPVASGAIVLLGLLSSVGVYAAQMLVGVGVAHLVMSWLRGHDPSARETLRFVVRRSPVALAALFVAFLIKAVSLVACGMGVVYTIPVLMVLAPVVAVEGTGPLDAVTRTLALGRRRWGPLLGIVVLWWFVSSAVSGGAQAVAAVLGLYIGGSVAGAAVGLQGLGVVASVLLIAVQVSVTALVYVDLRVRTEGLDVELDADELFGVVPTPAVAQALLPSPVQVPRVDPR